MVYKDNGITTSTRAFLNAFGFNLKENGQEKLEIYNRGVRGNPIGSFHRDFRYDRVNNIRYSTNGYLYVRVGKTFLKANIKANCINNGVVNQIEFDLLKEDRKIKGKVTFKVFQDNYCTCKVTIHSTDSNGKTIELLLNNGNVLFGANIKDNNGKEDILVDFSNQDRQGIFHKTGSIAYDEVAKCYLCSTKVEISGFEDKRELITVKESKTIRQGDKYRTKGSFRKEEKPSIKNLSKKEALSKKMVCAGNLLYTTDLSIGNSIRRLVRETIVVNDVSVVQNLATMCYEGYEMRGINALLGFTPDSSFYQGGIHSLNEAYFGISDRNPKDRRYSR